MCYDITYVANAYYEPVFVKVDTERSHTEGIAFGASINIAGKFELGGSFSREDVWDMFIAVGFAEILPREYVPFSPEGGRTVYITIWSSSKGFIWHNVPQPTDVSFIVKTNGAVVKSNGKNAFTDRHGNNLKPSVAELEAAAASGAISNLVAKFYMLPLQMLFVVFAFVQHF